MVFEFGLAGPDAQVTETELEEETDRLRFMGLDAAVIEQFRSLARDSLRSAHEWLSEVLSADAPPQWQCDCGEQLVPDDWAGNSVFRCSVCGRSVGIKAPGDGSGLMYEIDGPSDEWMSAHPEFGAPMYGEFDPEEVVENGLPPLVYEIESGTAHPLALWRSGQHAAVLYAYREDSGSSAFDDDYGVEIEHLALSDDGTWENTGSGGGSWIDPLTIPGDLLDKYVVVSAGLTGTGHGDEWIWVTGGYCSPRVHSIEIEEDGVKSRAPVDRIRRCFVVGTTAARATVRLLDEVGEYLRDHRGELIELALGPFE